MNKYQHPRTIIREKAARAFWESRSDSIDYLKDVAFGEFVAFRLSQALLS